ncbi:MAG TPA: ATP-binding protein [Rectinemataceae bacterium]|nr:ATP-binding protein [Rectinemataceae bacterium]
MPVDAAPDILLTGFTEGDRAALQDALGGFSKTSLAGDPINDPAPAFVLAAAYDETGLRAARAAALEDPRPWCFVVPASERPLFAAAAAAREGRLLLLPVEERELRRTLVALIEDQRERGAGGAAFAGLEGLAAAFSWTTKEFDVSRVCRRMAHLLAECGYYPGPGAEDECALALEEAVVNAVEHGNLELDSSLRSDDPLTEDRYEAERERKLADPAYGGRRISIELSITDDTASLVLGDEGPGFDTGAVSDEPSGFEVSGKGLWLIKRPFDEVSYNDKGNKLTLLKRKPRP